MISIVAGAAVFGAGGAGIWYFKPRGDRIHPLAAAPLLDSLIPIGIVTLLATGGALIISGAVSF